MQPAEDPRLMGEHQLVPNDNFLDGTGAQEHHRSQQMYQEDINQGRLRGQQYENQQQRAHDRSRSRDISGGRRNLARNPSSSGMNATYKPQVHGAEPGAQRNMDGRMPMKQQQMQANSAGR